MKLDSTSEIIHLLDPTQFLSKFLRKYTELAETHAHSRKHAHIHTLTNSSVFTVRRPQ